MEGDRPRRVKLFDCLIYVSSGLFDCSSGLGFAHGVVNVNGRLHQNLPRCPISGFIPLNTNMTGDPGKGW